MRRLPLISIRLIVCSTVMAHLAPASADFPTVSHAARPGLGESKFDENQTEKYTVNVTSGNLYVKQTDFVIPSSRGPSIEITRTYNSKGFALLHLLGKGNWSFSLNKFLEEKQFYRCDDPGDMEGVEQGDMLEEEPTYTEPGCCDDSRPDCCDGSYATCCDESFPSCCDTTAELDNLCDCCDDLETCYDDSGCDDSCAEASDEDSCIELCLFEECDDTGAYDDCLGVFCNSDGTQPSDCTEDDCDCVVDPPGYIDIDCEGCNWDYPCENEDDRIECGYLCPLCEDEDDCSLCDDCDSDCCCLDDSGAHNCGAVCGDPGQYEGVSGYNLHNGDGDGIMVFKNGDGKALATENPYHLEVRDEGVYNKVIFKDGTVYTFNKGLKGNIAFIDDRYGNRMTFTHDSEGKPTSVTDAVGRKVVIIYNGQGYISEIVAMAGTDEAISMYFYYDNGYLQEVEDFKGNVTYYGYRSYASAPPGLLDTITDADDHSVYFEYGEKLPYGTCTRVYKDNDAEGHTIGDTVYGYDWSHKITSIDSIIPGSPPIQTTKFYDEVENDNYYALKRVTKIEDPYGGETDYEYDEMFHLIATSDTNGLYHEMIYDAKGNMVTKIADPDRTGYDGLNYTMHWSYEPQFNQVTSFTDANGHAKKYHYVDDEDDDHGPPGVMWAEEDAEENVIHHWYNEHGQRTMTEDANNSVTRYEYGDQWGNLTRVIKEGPVTLYNPNGYFEASYTYDIWGNKITETDFNGNVIEYEYDPMNRLAVKIVYGDGDPIVTEYTYYDNGDKKEVIKPGTKVTTYSYDAGDRLSEVLEPENSATKERRRTRYRYDVRGNKVWEEDPNGNVTTFEYDALNRLGIKYEPLYKTTVYEYEGEGDSSTDGGSPEYTRKKDRYTMMEQTRVEWRGDDVDCVEISTYYEYDRLYRLKMVTDDLGGETEYDYDAVGNKKWEEDAEGRRTNFEYYDNNLLKKIIDPYEEYIKYTYDGMGNKASERDKNGHTTDYDYGDRNLLTKVTYPKHDTDDPGSYIYVEYVYDGMNKREEWDRNGNVTKFDYNARNLLTKTTWPTGDHTDYEYDDNGNKTLETDPNGNKVHYEYDELDRLYQKADAYQAIAGLTTTYEYDNVGNRVKITDGENRSTYYDYDALNRLTLVTDAAGGHTEYGYDTLGNKIWVKDAKGYERGYKTDYYYDTLNRLKKVVNPLGKETEYDYDKVGNRTDQWDAKEQHIHYEYDDLNRLTSRTFVGDGVTITYGYDYVGNRTSMTDSRAGMDNVVHEYDEINLLEDVTYSVSGKTIHYGYDNNGNRISMVDPEGAETVYHYDEMNRLDDLVDPDGKTTDYEYDDGSRLTDMTYPNGTWTHYDYDEANRITGIVTKSSSNEMIQSISYLDEEDNPAYDKVGNRKRMVDSTGVTTYDYDELYRLEKVVYPGGSTVEYEYDAVGNRDFKKVNGVIVEDYDYNNANQLTHRTLSGTASLTKGVTVTGTVSDPVYWSYSGVESVTVNGMAADIDGETFTAGGVELHWGENTISAVAKDKAGNTTVDTIDVTYDPDITAICSYEYDNNGNLEKMAKGVDGGIFEETEYEYDYENRLTKVILPNTATNEFVYDGDKRRVSSKSTEGTITRFLYDGVNNLGDYNEEWERTASYTQGIGIDKLIRRKGANGVRYYHADALGSTRLMTKPDQSTAATYTYDAWGKITNQTGERTNRHKFTGREWDAEINLQYNRARFYDPEIGRFITQDPLTKGPDDPTVTYYSGVYSIIHRYLKDYIDALEPHKTNRYVYCSNNPVNKIDPLGLDDDKDKTKVTGEAASAEQTGKTKAEGAGKPVNTGTEQKGKTEGEVRESEGAQRRGSDKSSVEQVTSAAESGHRESLTVTESGDKILTISEGGKSYSLNLGNNPQSFGGKHDTQVAQRTGLSESGKKIAGVFASLVFNAAEEGISETAKDKAGGVLRLVGKSGTLGIVTEALDRSFKIHSILTDTDKRISSGERAVLTGLHVGAGAATVFGGIGGGVVGGAIGSAFGGAGTVPGTIVGAAIGGTAVEKITDRIIDGRREVYRYNN